jgi:5-methyltetrahydropteroyltriglutamate--homocysteine methyltransferase
VKVTLPSPSLFANFWDQERSTAAYPNLEEFIGAVAEILRREVVELVELGCTYIKLDAPHYTLFVDPGYREFYAQRGWPAEQWLELGLEYDNLVIGDRPGVTFAFHLCRGNQLNRWLVSGGYDAIASVIFKKVKADRLMLEYDDARSGSFEPLAELPEDKVAVLGLVSTKTQRVESIDELRERVEQASHYFPLERLGVSPQCGFSTSIRGNALSVEQEGAKLRALAEAASVIWGE